MSKEQTNPNNATPPEDCLVHARSNQTLTCFVKESIDKESPRLPRHSERGENILVLVGDCEPGANLTFWATMEPYRACKERVNKSILVVTRSSW